MVIPLLEEFVAGNTPELVPMTTSQYHQLIGKEGFLEGSPIELIDGFMVRKNRSKLGEDPRMHHPDHVYAVKQLQRLAERVRSSDRHLQTQLPVTIPDWNEPEPDAALLAGTDRDYLRRHPGPADVRVVFEVSDSTLKYDRTTKQRIYAGAGIPIYWIVNLVDMQIEVYETPSPQLSRYEKRADFKAGQMVHLPLDSTTALDVAVTDLLPPPS